MADIALVEGFAPNMNSIESAVYEDENAKRVCCNCIRDEFLQKEIIKSGTIAVCDYCGDDEAETISIDALADHVETAFESHFEITRSEPNAFEWAMMKDDELNYEWEQEGEPVLWAIANSVQTEEAVAQDVLSVLQDRHYDHELAQMGENGPFDYEQYYDEKGPDDIELREDWRQFETDLKSETRFFSRSAQLVLDQVFEGITNHTQWDGTPVIIDAGPGTQIPSLFRARVFQSDRVLEEAMMRPDQHLGPPPFSLASAGRMNAHGISIFYGATTDTVALGEVRPPTGSQVLIAQFEILRPLKLLDVAALQAVFVAGSVFDPEYIHQLERAKFLQRLSDRISRPVMPDDQPFEYLITQVIADYLANKVEPALDGLAYPSAQAAGDGINVALFRKSSRVQEISFPKGTSLSADCWSSDEDGPYPEYSVIEETPAEEELKQAEEAEQTLHDKFGWFAPYARQPNPFEADFREPCLKVKEGSEVVHRVQSVQVVTETHQVRRHRWSRSDYKF